MFGLTEQEMDVYRFNAQAFAVQELTPKIVSNAKFMTPIIEKDGEYIPNKPYIAHLVSQIEAVILSTTTHMSYEYAYLQCETELTEGEIIRHLHEKYEDHVMVQFILYSIAFTSDILTQIITDIILELPYLYASAIDDDEFDEDEFLESTLEAYNQYMNENFADYGKDEEDNDDFEDEDFED